MSGFWDRRRAAVAAEAEAEVAAAQEQAAQAQEVSLAARDDDELLAELELRHRRIWSTANNCGRFCGRNCHSG
ncbi:hypothetical protein ACFQFQ_23665 [Sulfitobacter porphyrae]|uniref:Uncharacterized protein n=1 Tax=Sulfitobacter porphyrae TaxID=1246864 RepID=A0ABW2B8B7_9RHOB